MGLWFLTWFFMVVACEIAVHSFQFREADYQLTPLSAQEWQFGQVIAVAMVFLQLYDIVKHPFQSSSHGGKRLVYWWQYKARPFYRKCSHFGAPLIVDFRRAAGSGGIDGASQRCQKPNCICSEARGSGERKEAGAVPEKVDKSEKTGIAV